MTEGFGLTLLQLRISNKELFLIPTTKSSSSSFVALVGAQGRYIVSPAEFHKLEMVT